MSDISPVYLAQFVRSVAVLSLPADDQIRWLNSFGLPGEAAIADELGQEFDDGFLLLSQFVESGWITDAVTEKLRGIHAQLVEMFDSEDPDLWHVSALAHANEWAQLREMALEVLFAL